MFIPPSSPQIRKIRHHQYVHEGVPVTEPPVLLLHGMLGDVGNWTDTIRALAENGREVYAPVLPVYDLPLGESNVPGLTKYVRSFVEELGIERPVIIGNSLGGHVALLYAIQHPGEVPAMVLSGASGIYEINIGTSIPKRQSREYVRERAAITFYDPAHATDELVDEMLEIVSDRSRVIRLIAMARSTKQESVQEHLEEIRIPTLLVWGRDDQITPPDVGEQFLNRMPDARLVMIDRCGHAPMIEQPVAFNEAVIQFLSEVTRRPMPAAFTEAERSV